MNDSAKDIRGVAAGAAPVEAGHTPGPWVAVSDPLVPERGCIYISARGRFDPNETIGEAYKTDGDVDDGGMREAEANARLIAAAPDMKAQLEATLGTLCLMADAFLLGGTTRNAIKEECAAIRIALAKAAAPPDATGDGAEPQAEPQAEHAPNHPKT